MSDLAPLSFEALLAWALQGLERERSVFGLPRRSFWRGRDGFDLSVAVVGGRAETPLGPAAGPHTQLAHNIVVAWLAGSRVIELKTVQVLDRLRIPRPCIDAPAEGYNVEWSQELRLAQSLEQYVAAWCLMHALAARGLAGEPAARGVREGHGLPGTRLDASVGYDLAGVRSDAVAQFLDGLADASRALGALRDSLPPDLRAAADVPVPPRVVDTVTLSTFHGCPAEEIERIVAHLFDRHGVNVVVKLNPTLLGFEAAAHLVHDVLGRRDIALDPAAFERDLTWDHAVALLGRLAGGARRRGLELGIKLTNTLVVTNTRGRLAGDRVYLSGAPLHPIAVALADRLAGSPLAHLPRSFSAGASADNFADTVACGFAPVTTCTDLLQPTGYRRLPRYLKALEAEMERTGTRSVAEYVAARARENGATGGGADARANLAAYGARLAGGATAAVAAAAAPMPSRPALRFLDCASCNRCTLVCPNGAFFEIAVPPRRVAVQNLVLVGGAVASRATVFETLSEAQWVVDAGLCNACGNCDTFCPEDGGPHHVKPRLHRSRASYDADAPHDGVWIEAAGKRIAARFAGVEHHLEWSGGRWRFGNDTIEAVLDDAGAVLEARVARADAGHDLETGRFHGLRAIVEAVLREVNPVSVVIGRHGRP